MTVWDILTKISELKKEYQKTNFTQVDIRKKLKDEMNFLNNEFDRIKVVPKPKMEKPKWFDKKYNEPSDIPDDVYEYANKQSLLTSDANDAIRLARIEWTENMPRYRWDITIYRAVENNKYSDIRPWDWVTTQKEYAQQHNDMYFNWKWTIIEENVNWKQVLQSPTGNVEEAIYAPMEYSYKVNRKSKPKKL